MIIGGFSKKSLIEYKNKISCIVFTQGCNFKCPFCHNPELIPFTDSSEDEEKIFEYLKKYEDWIDAVAITGGEPTLQSDLFEFIKKVKNMGFLVKLETNGSNPMVLKKLIENNMIDFFQMDLKSIASSEEYNKLSGIESDIEKIKQSVNFIINSGVEYEFVTTAIPGYHDDNIIKKIREGFGIIPSNHRIQKYRDDHVYNREGVKKLIREKRQQHSKFKI